MMGAEQLAQRRGFVTIVALAVLTVIEFIVAVGLDSTQLIVVLLSIIALAKAVAIFWVFMHIAKLWRGEEEHA
jgi:heme/copper-type cytochrome/quinol oxidase subunit 4